MKFTYKARTQSGKIETGVIEASSKEAAAGILQKYNIFTTSLEAESSKAGLFRDIKIESKISTKDLAAFSRQLAVMLESRVPVIQSLTSLAAQTSKDNFRKVLSEVSHLVEEGVPLSEACAHFPKVFDNFYVNLVKSGELSGKISGSLYYIADHMDRENDIKSQVQQAMIYPIFTISVLFIVVNVIVIFLLPKIEDLIKQSSGTQPLFTVVMLAFYSFLGSWWWLFMLVFFLAVAATVVYFRTPDGRKVYDLLCLKIPFWGMCSGKSFWRGFAATLQR